MVSHPRLGAVEVLEVNQLRTVEEEDRPVRQDNSKQTESRGQPLLSLPSAGPLGETLEYFPGGEVLAKRVDVIYVRPGFDLQN